MATPTDSRSGTGSVLQRLGWQGILAATVLATIAAGAVLLIAADSSGDDDSATPPDSPSETLELTPAEDVPSGAATGVAFTTLDGGESTIAEIVDGPTVVNFFASWCPPCISEMPDFEAVSQELGDQVTFYGLAVTDRTADAERIVDQTGVTYDWARDVEGDVAGAAGVFNMPTTLFIDADGTIVDAHGGALSQSGLRDLIEEHLGVAA